MCLPDCVCMPVVCVCVCLLGIGHLGINIIKSGISFWIFLPVAFSKGVKADCQEARQAEPKK